MRKNILNDDNLCSDMLAELQAMLSEELQKPMEMRSFDTIAEITAAIAEISGGTVSDEKAASAADSITAELFAEKKRSRITMMTKYLSVISACIIMFIAFNFLSINSFGATLFDAVVSMRDDGFALDFSPSGDKEVSPTNTAVHTTETFGSKATTTIAASTTDMLADTTGDPVAAFPTMPAATSKSGILTTSPLYATTTAVAGTTGAIQEPAGDNPTGTGNTGSAVTPVQEHITIAQQLYTNCQRYGLEPCAPVEYDCVDQFMPMTDFETENMTDSDDFYFTFADDEHQIDIIIEHYFDPDDIPQLIIPMTEAGHWKLTGEVGEIYIFHKDDRMCAVFMNDNCVYTITGYNFDESFADFAVSFREPLQN